MQSYKKQGLDFQSVIDANIAKFNADNVEGFSILDREVCFEKAYRHQSNEYIEIVGQHWQILQDTIVGGPSPKKVSQSRSLS